MEKLNLELLCKKLDYVRQQWNLSWYQVWQLSGVSRTIIIRMEQGIEPDVVELQKLHDWLKDYIYRGHFKDS